MPIINSRYGILFGDGKPDRVCEWPDCSITDYSGRKMKACGRCSGVRYCSKDCQRQDWPYHKTICRNPSLLDVGGWKEHYAWLFKWAAMEAFEVHTDDWKILSNVMFVVVIRGDDLPGPMRRPFVIQSARIMRSIDVMKTSHLDGDTFSSNMDKSLEIRQNGGMGQALVVFMCLPRANCHTDPTVYTLETYPLYDKPLRSGYTHMAQWEAVLKGVANGDISISDISHMIGPSQSDAGAVEELDSKLEAMDI